MSMSEGVAAGETAVVSAEKMAVLAWIMSGAHFTEPTGLFMQVFTRIALVLALAFVAGRAAYAADTDWPDVEGRIQYGFYTEDARTLADVVNQLSGVDAGNDPLHHYYVGLANYRLSTVLAAKDKTRAREAAARCVSRLDVAVSGKSDFAEIGRASCRERVSKQV